MQELLALLGPGAWIIIVAAGYFTQALVNVWKMTGVKSNYVPVTAILTGIVVTTLLQVIQGLVLNPQGIAIVLLQGILAGLGAVGLTEVHKKAEAAKQAEQATMPEPVTPFPVNPSLPADYIKALMDQAFTGGYVPGPVAPETATHQEGEAVQTLQYYDAHGQPVKITRAVSVEGEPPPATPPQPPQETHHDAG